MNRLFVTVFIVLMKSWAPAGQPSAQDYLALIKPVAESLPSLIKKACQVKNDEQRKIILKADPQDLKQLDLRLNLLPLIKRGSIQQQISIGEALNQITTDIYLDCSNGQVKTHIKMRSDSTERPDLHKDYVISNNIQLNRDSGGDILVTIHEAKSFFYLPKKFNHQDFLNPADHDLDPETLQSRQRLLKTLAAQVAIETDLNYRIQLPADRLADNFDEDCSFEIKSISADYLSLDFARTAGLIWGQPEKRSLLLDNFSLNMENPGECRHLKINDYFSLLEKIVDRKFSPQIQSVEISECQYSRNMMHYDCKKIDRFQPN